MSKPCARISIEDKGDHLVAVCSRDCGQANCAACIYDILDAAQQHDKSRVLVDYTATEHPIPIVDWYGLGSRMVKRYVSGSARIAVVGNKEVVSLDCVFETAVRNVRVFTDDVKAVSWLQDSQDS